MRRKIAIPSVMFLFALTALSGAVAFGASAAIFNPDNAVADLTDCRS